MYTASALFDPLARSSPRNRAGETDEHRYKVCRKAGVDGRAVQKDVERGRVSDERRHADDQNARTEEEGRRNGDAEVPVEDDIEEGIQARPAEGHDHFAEYCANERADIYLERCARKQARRYAADEIRYAHARHGKGARERL